MSHATSRRMWWTTGLLCSHGFFIALRPSEPFLTPYLVNFKNIPGTVLNDDVYPFSTYAYLVFLVPILLLTDPLKYKPIVLLHSLSYTATWILLIWATGVVSMQFMQIIYGLGLACEIAYYTYIYSVVDKDKYQKVTSYTRSASLLGQFFSAVIGQLLISLGLSNYLGLNYISLSTVIGTCFIALALPNVKRGKNTEPKENERISEEAPGSNSDELRHSNDSYPEEPTTSKVRSDPRHYRDYGSTETNDRTHDDVPSDDKGGNIRLINDQTKINCWAAIRHTVSNYFKHLLNDIKSCYSDRRLFIWSLWWAAATCGNFQVGNYIQNLWDSIEPSKSSGVVYNGAVEATTTLLSSVMAFMLQYLHCDWSSYGEAVLGVVSLLDAGFLVIMALTPNIWLAYVLYILFRVSFYMVITIASFQIAQHLAVERYALVFGSNTFIALMLQSILTAIFVDRRGLNLKVSTQFLVTGSYFGLMGLAFIITAAHRLCRFITNR